MLPRSMLPRFNDVIHTLLIVCALCFSQQLLADVKLPTIDEQYVDIKVEDPKRDAGYVVGDILNRKVTITVKKPYQLIKESLPIVGYEHRYKGQVSGVELISIKSPSTKNDAGETYVLDLSYQVFKTGRTVKPAALHPEVLKMRNTTKKKQTVQYALPLFKFRISPLSVIGQVRLDREMYPFTPPLTLDSSPVIFKLEALAVVLALALLGLLYILGSRAWLPRMGAPFAKAFRDIKKMDDSPAGIKQAVTRVHTALNKTAGASLFNNNLAAFIAEKPAFALAKPAIEQFLGLSNQVFFADASQALKNDDPKAWLLKLCRTLRDCERGLVPDMAADGAKA